MLILPLGRRDRARVLLWAGLDGCALGIALATIAVLVSGAGPETGVVVRLLGPLGLLAGVLLGRVRLPALGVLVDGTGIELHGLVRTRRIGWDRVAAIGWTAPGRRLSLRTTGGRTHRSAVRLPRRPPAELLAAASARKIPFVANGTLKSAAAPTIEEPSPGR